MGKKLVLTAYYPGLLAWNQHREIGGDLAYIITHWCPSLSKEWKPILCPSQWGT